MQDIAMDGSSFSSTSLHTQLTEEVKALREILSLLCEEEQAILSNRRLERPTEFRNAKKHWQSLRKKRFNIIGSTIGCSDLSMLDVIFEKWIVDFDTEFDLSSVWEQSLVPVENTKHNSTRKKQKKLDIMDA